MNPTPEKSRLLKAIQAFKTTEELESFLDDLCTPGEIEAMEGRWAVAELLRQGVPYREVAERTGVSTATITRVARCLNEGTGYQQALALTEKTKKRKSK